MHFFYKIESPLELPEDGPSLGEKEDGRRGEAFALHHRPVQNPAARGTTLPTRTP